MHNLQYRIDDGADLPGMRVHRSYWVARGAIESVERQGGNLILVLANGTRVPVGRSYTEAARQLGIL